MNERQLVTVTEFCTVIKRIFQAEEMLKNIAIVGEISGFRAVLQISRMTAPDLLVTTITFFGNFGIGFLCAASNIPSSASFFFNSSIF